MPYAVCRRDSCASECEVCSRKLILAGLQMIEDPDIFSWFLALIDLTGDVQPDYHR
jgi:hypothetical protein